MCSYEVFLRPIVVINASFSDTAVIIELLYGVLHCSLATAYALIQVVKLGVIEMIKSLAKDGVLGRKQP